MSTEYGARAELARGLVGWSMEYRGKDPKGAKVQIGAELRWKSGKVKAEDRVRSTEDGKMRRPCEGAKRSGAPVQKWKGKYQNR